MSVLDIIVVAILVIFAVFGLIKGFLNTLLSLFGNLASLAVAIVIVKPCTKFLDNIFHIISWLGNLIIKGVQNANVLPDLTSSTMTSEEVISHLNGTNNLIGKLTSFFVDKDVVYGFEATDLTATLTLNMGKFAGMVFTVIVMFILLRIAVLILTKVFNAITKKNALGGIDRILGLVFGVVKGALYVAGILSIVYALSPLLPNLDGLIQSSNFTNFLYGYVNKFVNWLITTVDWKSLVQIK